MALYQRTAPCCSGSRRRSRGDRRRSRVELGQFAGEGRAPVRADLFQRGRLDLPDDSDLVAVGNQVADICV